MVQSADEFDTIFAFIDRHSNLNSYINNVCRSFSSYWNLQGLWRRRMKAQKKLIYEQPPLIQNWQKSIETATTATHERVVVGNTTSFASCINHTWMEWCASLMNHNQLDFTVTIIELFYKTKPQTERWPNIFSVCHDHSLNIDSSSGCNWFEVKSGRWPLKWAVVQILLWATPALITKQ